MRRSIEHKLTARAIRSDLDGFSLLNRLYQELQSYTNTDIILNVSELSWLDGHLAAPLSIVIRRAETNGNKIKVAGVQEAISRTLSRNRFLESHIEDKYKTTIPLTKFELNQAVEFSLFAKKHLDRPEIPKMTKALRGKFFEGIDELFANSALHSKSGTEISVCGQFFPHKDRLDFAIADGGRSIPGSLAASKIKYENDLAAVDWAMQPYNTTRQGDIPGGLGSKVLREFIALNNGRLLIISSAGYWCQAGSAITKALLRQPFPGTAVILEINTADKNAYDLVNAPNPHDIW
ncbi:MAG: hypothetical protein GC182_09960 [Rhodopseudomonas sp.]|nr:hypothetical protein [Rhodopseudomonas sp.]